MAVLQVVSGVYFFVTKEQVNLSDRAKSLLFSKHKGTYNKLPEFRICRSAAVMHVKWWFVYGTYQKSDIDTEIGGADYGQRLTVNLTQTKGFKKYCRDAKYLHFITSTICATKMPFTFNVLVTLNYLPILPKMLEQIRKEPTKTLYLGTANMLILVQFWC